jgi:hypothetical protein
MRLLGLLLLPAALVAQQAEPPVPSDPLELVPGDAQPAQDVAQRASIVDLLFNAHRHSNVRAQPYDLKTTLTVSGSSSSDGTWQLEDISPGPGLYRWTAQSPSYSAVHLNANRILYSSRTPDSLPLRLLQAREAIFYTQVNVGPHATVRTANASLNGVELVCALISRYGAAKAATGGRRWNEEEYCLDPKASTLVIYSLVPGLYVVYDYSKAIAFHDKLIPNKFTITQAGQTVVEAETESVTDPANNPAAFQPAGLTQVGVGPIMTAPWRFRTRMPSPSAAPAGTAQIVVLHAMQSPDGQLSDVELLASSEASLNQAALAFASKWQGGMMGKDDVEPGVTPQSHEVILTLEYLNNERDEAGPQQ